MSGPTGGLHQSPQGKHRNISNHISFGDQRWETNIHSRSPELARNPESPPKRHHLHHPLASLHHLHSFMLLAVWCIFFCVGSNMEMLGRRALWEVGLNYGHGTGHGVGNYFGVHECTFPLDVIPLSTQKSERRFRTISVCKILSQSSNYVWNYHDYEAKEAVGGTRLHSANICW